MGIQRFPAFQFGKLPLNETLLFSDKQPSQALHRWPNLCDLLNRTWDYTTLTYNSATDQVDISQKETWLHTEKYSMVNSYYVLFKSISPPLCYLQSISTPVLALPHKATHYPQASLPTCHQYQVIVCSSRVGWGTLHSYVPIMLILTVLKKTLAKAFLSVQDS